MKQLWGKFLIILKIIMGIIFEVCKEMSNKEIKIGVQRTYVFLGILF